MRYTVRRRTGTARSWPDSGPTGTAGRPAPCGQAAARTAARAKGDSQATRRRAFAFARAVEGAAREATAARTRARRPGRPTRATRHDALHRETEGMALRAA